jgi:hypothetical protein
MRYAIRFCVAMMLAAAASVASAAFHLFKVEQIYSNADGTVQFIVLKNQLFDGENFWQGRRITSLAPGVSNSFTFPSNLPDGFTSGKRVLVATQGFAALGLIVPDYVIPNHFVLIPGGNVNFADVYNLSYANLPTDGVNALYNTGAVARNLATNYAGQSVSLGAPTANNYQGLWWNSPAGSESGWGINFAHQGDVIFASWFTYDLSGKGWWLVMTAPNTSGNTFSGSLLSVTGPAFDAVPFDPNQVAGTVVGTGTLNFTDANNGTFAYTVNGISQTKNITREIFGPLPTCAFGAQANLALAANYQDLWWKTPAGSESGWGINFTHQGDSIFATWFTYDHDRTPMWLVVTANKTAPGTYTGTLYRTTGPAFNAVPFNPAAVAGTNVGTATLTFTDGNTASFAYTVNGVSQVKPIIREIFRPPGTVCQ